MTYSSREAQAEVVRACFLLIKDYPAINSPRTSQERKIEKEVGRQHPRMDWIRPEKIPEGCGGQRQVYKAGGIIFKCALTASVEVKG